MTPDILDIFDSAVRAADPYSALKQSVRVSNNSLQIQDWVCDLSSFDQVMVVGAGKGVAGMAQALEEILTDRIREGIVIVKYGHTRPIRPSRPSRIVQIEAGHPLPDHDGVAGTLQIMELLRKTDGKTLVFCLLTGGGSALLVSPTDGMTLNDKQKTTELLLNSGATIQELNTVRKHLSKVKGGRLAQMAEPATVVTLILSDVIGDRLDVIASGPTVPDGTTFRDALEVIQKYGLKHRLPDSVSVILEKGVEGKIAETPKADNPCFKKSRTFILGNLSKALDAALKKALLSGLNAHFMTAELQGEARDAAKHLAGKVRETLKSQKEAGKPLCLVSGGETTVTVTGKGRGGRNQELALAFAIEIAGNKGVTLLSAGTDGTDGETDAAGAVVNGETAAKARSLGLDPETYLQNNDAYTFFRKLDALSGESHLIITGPTGTNVMDIQIIIVEKGLAG